MVCGEGKKDVLKCTSIFYLLEYELCIDFQRAVYSVTSFPSLTQRDSSGLADEFVDTVGLSGTDAAAPSDHSTVDGTCNHRLVEDLQHITAWYERGCSRVRLISELNRVTPGRC